MRKIMLFIVLMACSCFVWAGGPEDSVALDLQKKLALMDSIENAMQWKTGAVIIASGAAKLNIPASFKFLGAEQSRYILHDIWGNPERNDVLGMIFPSEGGPFSDSSFAFVITFEETGYIKDADADKIDYAEMLASMQKEEIDVNKERAKAGYEAIHLLKWAQTPYYDKNRKVLHWAKELKFGTNEDNTLNYDVRVLGRKGILSLNAIASMSELALVKDNINQVLSIPEFTEGNRYSDFDSKTDKVAEYGIGALIAGGVLAKTGVLAMIGKFFLAAWKFILLGFIGAAAWIKKLLAARKNRRAGNDMS